MTFLLNAKIGVAGVVVAALLALAECGYQRRELQRAQDAAAQTIRASAPSTAAKAELK